MLDVPSDPSVRTTRVRRVVEAATTQAPSCEKAIAFGPSSAICGDRAVISPALSTKTTAPSSVATARQALDCATQATLPTFARQLTARPPFCTTGRGAAAGAGRAADDGPTSVRRIGAAPLLSDAARALERDLSFAAEAEAGDASALRIQLEYCGRTPFRINAGAGVEMEPRARAVSIHLDFNRVFVRDANSKRSEYLRVPRGPGHAVAF